jgi:hypothetical protein
MKGQMGCGEVGRGAGYYKIGYDKLERVELKCGLGFYWSGAA